MVWPWFIGVALIASIAVMSVLRYRNLKRIKDKVDRGEARWEDDWDPFR